MPVNIDQVVENAASLNGTIQANFTISIQKIDTLVEMPDIPDQTEPSYY